jgi:hypothetical protein
LNPDSLRQLVYILYEAKINECVKSVFGKTPKKIPKQTFKNSPAIDISQTGEQLYDQADHSANSSTVHSAQGLNFPRRGRNGTVAIAKGSYTDNSLLQDEGIYVHELGNILGARYGLDRTNRKYGVPQNPEGTGGVGDAHDVDNGAHFQKCVLPSSINY